MFLNTLLILIVSIGEWPRFPCGRIAFGCLHLSGNCFSRLGEFPPFWSLSQAENGALGYSSFPVNTHSQQWDTPYTPASFTWRAVPMNQPPLQPCLIRITFVCSYSALVSYSEFSVEAGSGGHGGERGRRL